VARIGRERPATARARASKGRGRLQRAQGPRGGQPAHVGVARRDEFRRPSLARRTRRVLAPAAASLHGGADSVATAGEDLTTSNSPRARTHTRARTHYTHEHTRTHDTHTRHAHTYLCSTHTHTRARTHTHVHDIHSHDTHTRHARTPIQHTHIRARAYTHAFSHLPPLPSMGERIASPPQVKSEHLQLPRARARTHHTHDTRTHGLRVRVS